MPTATSTSQRRPDEGENNARGSPQWWVVGPILLAAAVASWSASHHPELFHLEMLDSPAGWILLAAVASLGAWMFLQPDLGPPLLASLVYLNLSQILVRYHSLPSILQLLALPLAVLVLVRMRTRAIAPNLNGLLLVVLLCAYNLLLLFSSTVALDSSLADERWAENGKALLLFIFVAVLSAQRAVAVGVVRAIVASAAFLSSLTIVQVLLGDYRNEMWGLARVKDAQIYGDVLEERVAGPLGDPNFFAQVLLIAVPLALVLSWREEGRGWQIGAGLAAATIVTAILLTYSRGGAIALVLVLAASALIHPQRGKALAALLLVGALLVPFLPEELARRWRTMVEVLPGEQVLHPDSAIAERRLYTEVALQLFLSHPWLGVGAGNYSVHFREAADRVGSDARDYHAPDERYYPHSLYLEIAAETGVLGLLSFAAVVMTCLVSLARSRLRFLQADDAGLADLSAAVAVALGGYLVAALFLHGHHQRYLWLLFAVVAALARVTPRAATARS